MKNLKLATTISIIGILCSSIAIASDRYTVSIKTYNYPYNWKDFESTRNVIDLTGMTNSSINQPEHPDMITNASNQVTTAFYVPCTEEQKNNSNPLLKYLCGSKDQEYFIKINVNKAYIPGFIGRSDVDIGINKTTSEKWLFNLNALKKSPDKNYLGIFYNSTKGDFLLALTTSEPTIKVDLNKMFGGTALPMTSTYIQNTNPMDKTGILAPLKLNINELLSQGTQFGDVNIQNNSGKAIYVALYNVTKENNGNYPTAQTIFEDKFDPAQGLTKGPWKLTSTQPVEIPKEQTKQISTSTDKEKTTVFMTISTKNNGSTTTTIVRTPQDNNTQYPICAYEVKQDDSVITKSPTKGDLGCKVLGTTTVISKTPVISAKSMDNNAMLADVKTVITKNSKKIAAKNIIAINNDEAAINHNTYDAAVYAEGDTNFKTPLKFDTYKASSALNVGADAHTVQLITSEPTLDLKLTNANRVVYRISTCERAKQKGGQSCNRSVKENTYYIVLTPSAH